MKLVEGNVKHPSTGTMEFREISIGVWKQIKVDYLFLVNSLFTLKCGLNKSHIIMDLTFICYKSGSGLGGGRELI